MAGGCSSNFYKKKTKELRHSKSDSLASEKAVALVSRYSKVLCSNLGKKQESELYHHGILGQKWGERNGPPYPLGSSDHSTSEKKAGWKKSIGGGSKDTSDKKITITDDMSSTTKKVVKDYNSMTNKEFAKKYQVTKSRYAKRVEKWGDPYLHAVERIYGKEYVDKIKQEEANKLIEKEETQLVKKGWEEKDAELDTLWKEYNDIGYQIKDLYDANGYDITKPDDYVLPELPDDQEKISDELFSKLYAKDDEITSVEKGIYFGVYRELADKYGKELIEKKYSVKL